MASVPPDAGPAHRQTGRIDIVTTVGPPDCESQADVFGPEKNTRSPLGLQHRNRELHMVRAA